MISCTLRPEVAIGGEEQVAGELHGERGGALARGCRS